MLIRPIRTSDAARWAELRNALWPDPAGHGEEIASFFRGTLVEPVAVFVTESEDGEMIAIMELSIRTDVPGVVGQRTGYVEGLYVEPNFRGRDVATKLLDAARVWAKEQGCVAVASDRAERIVIDPRFATR